MMSFISGLRNTKAPGAKSALGFFGTLALTVVAGSMWLAPAESEARQGAAPGFTGIDAWVNSAPLTMQQLRGKVVLVNFWTYGCFNCRNALPYVKSWYAKYKDQGFVVVGVHTPEFPIEHSLANVETAVRRLGITFPVAQDNSSATWNAWSNQFWPAEYLIDKNGQIVHTHFGEGGYGETEALIKSLLSKG